MDDVFAVFEQFGDADYIGEPISQLEHMLQAARLAQRSGGDDALILGSFFHDIGHLCAPVDAPQMDGLGVLDHEHIGADYLLACGYSLRVADLVRLHVQAKRYLCFKNPRYAANLSAASTGTLAHQGGPMDVEEAMAFESHPLHKDILRLRTWDEAAKVVDGDAMTLTEIRAISERHLAAQQGK